MCPLVLAQQLVNFYFSIVKSHLKQYFFISLIDSFSDADSESGISRSPLVLNNENNVFDNL